MLALAAWMLIAATADASVAGVYQSRQMEVGAALELQSNGRFRYQLDYGAVSESAEGDWTFDGRAVRLTTRPAPRAPAFELVRDDPAPKGELYMTLEDPGFQWGHPLRALAAIDGREQAFKISADDSGRVDLAGKPPVVAVAPLMPAYGPTGDSFPLSSDRGHRLLFRFHANDLGKAAFRGEPLVLNGRDLVLTRYDTSIRFMRVRP